MALQTRSNSRGHSVQSLHSAGEETEAQSTQVPCQGLQAHGQLPGTLNPASGSASGATPTLASYSRSRGAGRRSAMPQHTSRFQILFQSVPPHISTQLLSVLTFIFSREE